MIFVNSYDICSCLKKNPWENLKRFLKIMKPTCTNSQFLRTWKTYFKLYFLHLLWRLLCYWPIESTLKMNPSPTQNMHGHIACGVSQKSGLDWWAPQTHDDKFVVVTLALSLQIPVYTLQWKKDNHFPNTKTHWLADHTWAHILTLLMKTNLTLFVDQMHLRPLRFK